MPQQKTKKKEKIQRAPRLSKTSRIVLVAGIFFVTMIPLFLFYQAQPANQAALSNQLFALQKLAEASKGKSTPVETEIAQAAKELKVAKEAFPRVDSAPDMLEEMLVLAKANGIEVTSTSITRSKRTITQGKQKIDFPLLILRLGVRGQVPKFQNFLLSLDSKFPLYRVTELNIDIAQTEKEQDKATITLEVVCFRED